MVSGNPLEFHVQVSVRPIASVRVYRSRFS